MLQLYYSPGACSLAPHIVLEEIEVLFEAHAIDLAQGEQDQADYRSINPRGRVPALIVDGEVVTEVPALLTYLASLRPSEDLVPEAGTIAFARCFEWLAFLSSSLHVAYAQFRRPQRFLPPDAPDVHAFTEQGREHVKGFYREIEQRLIGPWALGENYSLVDPYLLPFYLWDQRVEMDLAANCPRWTAWKERMARRPAVRRAAAREGLEL
jgi:glutathione S-transferase